MEQTENNTYYTIGHSNLKFDEFLNNVTQHNIDYVVDVRSWPKSRWCPWFNQVELELDLPENGIGYRFLGRELGARRDEFAAYNGKAAEYDLIAQLPAYELGIKKIVQNVSTYGYRIAVMCSEGDPITCHRMILISRTLEEHGLEPIHILRDGSTESMYQANDRLMLKMKTQNIDEAYAKQSAKICYKKK